MKNKNYEVPSIAKNKKLRKDILNTEIRGPIVKSNALKKQITDSIFEDKEIRHALEMLSKV